MINIAMQQQGISFYFVSFVAMLPVALLSTELNLESPRIYIHQKTSLGNTSVEVVPDSVGMFTLAGNVAEIHLACWSAYPTKWMMVPSPHRVGSNIKEWHIDKGRHVTDMSNGKMEFWSEVVIRFTNTPSRVLQQTAACHHYEPTSISVNRKVEITSTDDGILRGQLYLNANLSRRMGERYGRNKDCSLVMHLDVSKNMISCESLKGIKTTPDFIQCANPDECDANIRQSDCDNLENYEQVNFKATCTSKTCVSYETKPGALICEFEGGGRKNSLAQIVYYGFKMNPFYQTPTTPLPETASRLQITKIETPATKHGYYNGTKAKFHCNAALWYFSKGLQWGIVNGDNREMKYLGAGVESTDEKRTTYSSIIEIQFSSTRLGATRVTCFGPVLNSYDWETATIDAFVKRPIAPTILNLTEVTSKEKSTAELHCTASGTPIPRISWHKNGIVLPDVHWKNTEDEIENTVTSVLYVIPNPGATEHYDCEAISPFYDNQKMTITITHPSNKIHLAAVIGVPVGILVILLVVAGLVYRKIRSKYREIQKLTEEEIHEFTHGDRHMQNENSPLFFPYNTEFEIPKSKIRFESKVLGDGQFGKVTRGKLDKTFVAIKTVKKFADISYLKALLSELKICCFVGQHQHIVNLIGGCTQNIEKREVYLIYEYCANGNVLKYLRKYKDQFVNHLAPHGRYTATRHSIIDYQNVSVKKISSKDLLRWAAEIASGMEFLNDKNIIHGDLAARNILLTESLTAKVGDFGLSKQLSDYTVYVQRLECPLPLKWMAIESLRDLEFSVKSDIWSYGVTLWELYSLGQPPYPGIPSWDCSSWKLLQEGYRMAKPPYASDEVYNFMLRCWLAEPESRPTFSMLKHAFEGLSTLITGAPSLKIH